MNADDGGTWYISAEKGVLHSQSGISSCDGMLSHRTTIVDGEVEARSGTPEVAIRLKDVGDMPILITVGSRGLLKLRMSLGGGRGDGNMQYMVPRGAVPTSYV